MSSRFARLCTRLGLSGRMPRIVASGPRAAAYEDFRNELRRPDGPVLLLVDSEDPVTTASPWVHLANRPSDQWSQPAGATDDDCHLMVQCMEAWLVADAAAVARFFGQDFQAAALPKRKNVENIPKAQLLNDLKHASRNCTKHYAKGPVSFELLAEVDPAHVRRASPRWAARFFDQLAKRS